MTINVCNKKYTVDQNVNNILKALDFIKTKLDKSLAYRCGCKSGVCGSCAIRVNGVERLACKTNIKDGDIIEPLKNSIVVKDLVVDIEQREDILKKIDGFIKTKSDNTISIKDEKKIDKETNCILCGSCFSACPVFEVNKEFLGPFALVKSYRYIEDQKESDISNKIEAIQEKGIWDCTLCGGCDMVCPAHIPIKNNIMQLQNKSVMLGYNNPNIANYESGFDTTVDFGFNPNQF